MLTQYNYLPLAADWDKKIEECCNQPNPDNPSGVDCCFDKWTTELKEVNQKYKEAEEEARQKSAEFAYISERRDQLKKWFDELTRTGDLQKALCDQLEILLTQVEKVGCNTQHTVDAVKLLFCMIREYYLQLDILQEKYESLLDCIKCLKSTTLVPGAGLMKCIEDFGAKLAAAQAHRTVLITKVMEALSYAEKIDLGIAEDKNPASPDYGLLAVVTNWQNTLNCSEACGGSSEQSQPSAKKQQQKPGGIQSSKEGCEDDNCDLVPMLYLPVCNDPYYADIENRYKKDKSDAETLANELRDLNKRKESLLACKQSLEAAIKEVNPKERCK